MKHLVRAFTIVEILVAVGIFIVLFGILQPVFLHMKQEGREASDLSKLHQIGLAASIYESETAIHPTSCTQLVSAGKLDQQMCAGSGDPYPRGFTNEMLEEMLVFGIPKSRGPYPFRVTFTGKDDLNVGDSKQQQELLESAFRGSQGWLIDRYHAELDSPNTFWFAGPIHGNYRRLLDDGAVVSRPWPYVSVNHPGYHALTCFSPWMLYGDFDGDFLKRNCTYVGAPK
jgi:competence protein ComGC